MTDIELFFRLLDAALWNAEPELDCTPPDLQWQNVFDMACRQTVQGIMFDAVRKLPQEAGMPRRLAARWMVETGRIEQLYSSNAEVAEFMQRLWDSGSVRAVQLKGLTLAAMYDNPSHRFPGDIDWWIPGGENWQRALDLVKERGYTVETDSDGDISYSVQGVTVEHHRNGLKATGPEGMLLLVNEHILHHVSVTGIGMRQFCDMAMAYRHYSGSYDRNVYSKLLETEGLKKWTLLLDSVLVHFLGTPETMVHSCGLVPGEPVAAERRLVRLVMDDGNFGLEKPHRYSGFLSRALLLLKHSPGYMLKRWLGLVAGRIKRHSAI